jgi:hypothetical protein
MFGKIAQELWEFGVLVAAAGPSLNLTISAEAEPISFREILPICIVKWTNEEAPALHNQ